MRIRKTIMTASLACLCIAGAKAQDTSIYMGYAPLYPAQEETYATGTGENKFLEVAMCIDPSADPLTTRLKGSEIVGVRCFLSEEYRQKSKEFSSVALHTGTLGNETERKIVNFDKGWNEIMFETPQKIGDEKIYLSARVFELLGAPRPFASYKRADGTFFMNEGKTEWEEHDDEGPLLMQAIIKTDAANVANSASAEISYHPLSIQPESEYQCSVYIHNWSAEPLSSVEIRTTADGLDDTRTIELNPAIQPFDGRVTTATLRTGSKEDDDAEYTFSVVKTNGQTAQDVAPRKDELYITKYIFTRIPVVEEFTGLTCSNCPFMSYYLDIAFEEYGKPYVYIAHHAGFQEDELTTEADRSLLFLFEDVTFNPAVMYDRRALGEDDTTPLYGARETSHEPYLNSLKQTELYPAEAMVIVNAEESEDGSSMNCTVEGKISNIALQSGDKFYISTYLLEDSISTDVYPQAGMDTPGAPADLAERFRHNGVIRHIFNNNPEGDELTVNGNDFRVEYNGVVKTPDWNWDNCQFVAIVHRLNKEDRKANHILNGGSSRLNEIAKSVEDVSADGTGITVYADSSRRICTSAAVRSLEVYSMQGCAVDSSESLQPGLYVVKCTSASGKTSVHKVAVR